MEAAGLHLALPGGTPRRTGGLVGACRSRFGHHCGYSAGCRSDGTGVRWLLTQELLRAGPRNWRFAFRITVGSVGLSGDSLPLRGIQPAASLDANCYASDRGDLDLAAVGRALITDLIGANKVRDGRTSELHSFSPAALATLV